MEREVRERIKLFLEKEKGTSVSAFAKSIGENVSKWTKQMKNTSIALRTILLLHEHFSELSLQWLLLGEGEMYLLRKNTPVEVTEPNKSDDYLVHSLFEQLAAKDVQIAEKDKQLAAAHAENAKLLDLAKVKIIKSTFNDVNL